MTKAKTTLAALLLCCSWTTPASAQFTGPTVSGRTSTVAEAKSAPVESYVTVTGRIVEHLREDYYTFRDDSGEIRVEIGAGVWQGRKVGAESRVRLLAEVDRSPTGSVYLWVKSLDVVE